MKYYYALFTRTEDAIEVAFPDLEGCVTFGKDWEEAIQNAEDVVAAWLAHADPPFVNTPSTHDELKHLRGELIPISVNEHLIESYQELKRFNVIFPLQTLHRVDVFRKKTGLKRSTFLQIAAEEYIQHHDR